MLHLSRDLDDKRSPSARKSESRASQGEGPASAPTKSWGWGMTRAYRFLKFFLQTCLKTVITVMYPLVSDASENVCCLFLVKGIKFRAFFPHFGE